MYYIFLCVAECVRVVECVGARARMCACARIVFLIQHAARRDFAICGLSGSAIFFDIIS
jgi:hypothetical protein